MQSPFIKAGVDLILSHWQQGETLDAIVRTLKTDRKAYLRKGVICLHVYHVYNVVHGARKRGDARATRRAQPHRNKTRQQSSKLIALFKRGA